jgi:hypothetical protein
MQYLLLLYDNEQRWSSGYTPEEMKAYGAFHQEFQPAIKGGNALQPSSTGRTVRVRDGQTLSSDGPFAETKEQLAGYYLVDAASIDEAAKMAAKIPAARWGSVEVRPIMTFS